LGKTCARQAEHPNELQIGLVHAATCTRWGRCLIANVGRVYYRLRRGWIANRGRSLISVIALFSGEDDDGRWRTSGNAEFGVHQVRLHGHPGEPGSGTAPQRQRFTGRRGRRKRLRIVDVRDGRVVVPSSGEAVATAGRRLPPSHARPFTASPASAVTDRHPAGSLHVLQPVCPGDAAGQNVTSSSSNKYAI